MQDEVELMQQSAVDNQQELRERQAQIAGLREDALQAETRSRATRKTWEELRAALKPPELRAPLRLPPWPLWSCATTHM